jgi:hypothetical protein
VFFVVELAMRVCVFTSSFYWRASAMNKVDVIVVVG